MPRIILPAFSKGEISPELHGRVDAEAYAVGLATARNAIVHSYGGISRRPGTKWIGYVKDHTYSPRLVEFQFKTTDSYVLEFGDFYLRFIRDDGHVLEEATKATITGATQANPVVITATAHGYSDGDEVFIEDVGGMTELNLNRYLVANKTSNTYELTHQVDGTNVDGTGFSTYTSGGKSTKIYEIATPYAVADLFDLAFTQSADVMTIVHQDYDIRELSRADHDDWSLDRIPISTSGGPPTTRPGNITITADTTGSETYRYKVSGINRETGLETTAGNGQNTSSINDMTNADPIVITTSSPHGLSDGDEIALGSLSTAMPEINDALFIVANSTSTTLELNDHDGFTVDGTNFTTYTSGGVVLPTYDEITNGAATIDNTITWNLQDGASRYIVYRRENGLYGFIGETELGTFKDDNISPDFARTPVLYRNPFLAATDNPGAVGYYQQRRVFGGSLRRPDTNEFSQTGDTDHYGRSFTTLATDGITSTLTSQQVNEIRHYMALNDLVVFTSGGEWIVSSGPDQAFTPSSIKQQPQTNWGISRRPPIAVGETVLFVTEDLANIRSIGYSFQNDSYTGANLNVISRHLLRGFTIFDWCQQRLPDSRIYIVRDDGNIITLSYEPEQELIAWTRFDTLGQFEACASLKGESTFGEDAVYFVVRREINGNAVRYIEVMRQSPLSDVRDAFYVDSGLSLDSPAFINDVTEANPVVVTTLAAHGFSDGDEVDIFDIVWTPDTDNLANETQPDQLNGKRFTVANKTSTTFELTDSDGNNIDGTGFNSYIRDGTARVAQSSVTGLEHLEGEEVHILADGNILPTDTVSNASLSFTRKYSRIHVGLQNVADVETLNIELGQGTIQGRLKRVYKAIIRLFKTRGMLIGPNNSQLVEMKQRTTEDMGDPTDLLSGDKELQLPSSWNSNGRVFIRQPDPLPMTIAAIVPVFEVDEDD